MDILIYLLAATCVVLVPVVLYWHWLRYALRLRSRLNELSNKSAVTAKTSPLFRDLKRWRTETALTRGDLRTRWTEFLEQSGLNMSLAQLIQKSLVLGIGLPVIMVILSRIPYGPPLIAAPICGGIGLLIPTLYVQFKRSQRTQQLCLQIPEAFDVMGRAIRAGQTVPAALQIVANDFTSPIADEFASCYEQQNLGLSSEAAFRNLARRTGVMELRIFVVALLVQGRSGGNLVELLRTLAEMTRKRLRMQARVKAMTGEGRMQALVLMVLPIVAFLAITVLAPEYSLRLLKYPRVIGMTILAQIMGCLWIRRIVNIDY
jgi:tight adherence protein B